MRDTLVGCSKQDYEKYSKLSAARWINDPTEANKELCAIQLSGPIVFFDGIDKPQVPDRYRRGHMIPLRLLCELIEEGQFEVMKCCTRYPEDAYSINVR